VQLSVEHLLSKHKALGLTSSMVKKKKSGKVEIQELESTISKMKYQLDAQQQI
jgi:hypothetical protein